jgi:DNA-binding SARP family transcriptional activator
VADDDLPAGAARLRLMGEFRLTDTRGHAVPIVSRRARCILAYLALIPGHSAPRERLCGLLWSDRGESQARASLRQCLAELTEATAAADLDLLSIGRTHVALVHGSHRSDIAELEWALALDDPEPLSRLLKAVGATPFLEDLEIGGLYGDWRDQACARLDHVISSGVAAHLGRLEAGGAWNRARQLADSYLRRDPLDEVVAATAIRAEVALGATAAAHRRFQALEIELKRQLGVKPGPAVRQALSAGPSAPSGMDAAAIPSPANLSPERRGEYRQVADVRPWNDAPPSEPAPPALPAPTRRSLRYGRSFAIGAAALSLVAALAGWLLLQSPRPARTTLHYLGFRLLDSKVPAELPANIDEAVFGAFSDDGQVGVSRLPTRRDVTLAGALSDDGEVIRVSARVEHASTGGVLWSKVYQQPASRAGHIADWIAAQVTSVASCGLSQMDVHGRPLADGVMSLIFAQCAAELEPGWELRHHALDIAP